MSNKIFTKENYKIIFEDGIRNYPDEACGLIVGKREEISTNQVKICTNIQNRMHEQFPDKFNRDATVGYYIDPIELFKIFNNAEKAGLDTIGFYHSHPDSDPYWSKEDNRAAMFADTNSPSYPDAVQLVVSVYDKKIKGGSVYLWDERLKSFKEIVKVDSDGNESETIF